MSALPSALRHLLITLGLVVGLLAATGGVAAAATPTPAGGESTVAAGMTQQTWNIRKDRPRCDPDYYTGDSDHHQKCRSEVTAKECREGKGRVDQRKRRCVGGRFDGASIVRLT